MPLISQAPRNRAAVPILALRMQQPPQAKNRAGPRDGDVDVGKVPQVARWLGLDM